MRIDANVFLADSSYHDIDVLQKNILIIISAYCILNNYLVSVHPNNIQIIDPNNQINWTFNYYKEFDAIKSWIRNELIENDETRFSYEPRGKALCLSYYNIFYGTINLTDSENDLIYESIKNYYRVNGTVLPANKFSAAGGIFRKYAQFLMHKLSIEIKEFFL